MSAQRQNQGKRSHSQSDYADEGGKKRKNNSDDKEQHAPGADDTVYRFLCAGRKIGCIIGKGGEIIKQLRADTHSKIRIGENLPGCEERVVTVFSSRKGETTKVDEDSDEYVCPAQHALFRILDKIVADDGPAADEDGEKAEGQQVIVRLLVQSDQIGCVIEKGGQMIQNIRTETGTEIRFLKNNLPLCALTNDELLEITGEVSVVKKALHQVSSRLHDNPSRSQHLLTPAPSLYHSRSQFMGSNAGAPIMGSAPIVNPYGPYESDAGGAWSRNPYYPGPRNDSSAKEFSLHLVCSTGNIGVLIGKGGVHIKQIRQESGAFIKVNSSAAEGDDCIISVSAKEHFDDPISPTIHAAVRLQPKCSHKSEKESGDPHYTTRLLVPASRIGCVIGKGGAIITEIGELQEQISA